MIGQPYLYQYVNHVPPFSISSLSLAISIPLYLSVYHVPLFLNTSLSLSLSIYLPYPSFSPSILSLSISIMPLFLSISSLFSLYLPLYLSIYLSIYLSCLLFSSISSLSLYPYLPLSLSLPLSVYHAPLFLNLFSISLSISMCPSINLSIMSLLFSFSSLYNFVVKKNVLHITFFEPTPSPLYKFH